MELKNLVGKHILTGVSRSRVNIAKDYDPEQFEDSEVFSFILDGTAYSAIEDPSDGYRSSMRELKINEYQVENIFQPIEVFGVMRKEQYRGNDVLDLYDSKNAMLILSAGTSNTDDYYPSFVSEWLPENLSINQK